MTLVAVLGEGATTTSVALAVAWPSGDRPLLVEADPSGGDLIAWFDLANLPSLSTAVSDRGGLDQISPHLQHSERGLRVVPAPISAVEAAQAVAHCRAVIGPLNAEPIVIADLGRCVGRAADHPLLDAASAAVVLHRQATQSARAAAAGLQRLVERLELLSKPSEQGHRALIVALVGSGPFGPAEITAFVAKEVGSTPIVALPVDQLAAAVIGGRRGVSSRRFARLPLVRSARCLAESVARTIAAEAVEEGVR